MCWSRTKRTSSSSHWKLTCSRHDIAEKLLNWRWATITHYIVTFIKLFSYVVTTRVEGKPCIYTKQTREPQFRPRCLKTLSHQVDIRLWPTSILLRLWAQTKDHIYSTNHARKTYWDDIFMNNNNNNNGAR